MMKVTAQLLLTAYTKGVFPMADEDGQILWFDPDPRAIIPLNRFHASRSLRRTVRQEKFEIRYDTDFKQVIAACASPAAGREETWINQDILAAYEHLYHLGFAHSVESWQDGELVGGLYGVAIRGFFAGESMFSRQRDASKVALVHLVGHLRARGYLLLDVQFMTEHLRRFGAIEVTRRNYQHLLSMALDLNVSF